MYLKSIELCGFKSFAERTKLVFNSGITTVVGPNGCGKTNIVEAFRWCLGEQSAHSLRSQQMSSVIFNGSQTRAPSGFAEVSLTFDNSENTFSLNYAEITVTRKLFRSGESEYYINRTQCRMKDIRDLFLDTGIGTEGYSVFEQGRVEFVTNAKPDERRGLFEEAAGVAKYKVRREETLHKLDRVHQDMDRVSDMMGVIKEQIRLLESAVRKAKLYRKYQEELRVLELADVIKKIVSLDEELSPAEKSLEEKNNKFTETNSRFDMLDAELLKLRLQMTEYDDKLIELQKKMTRVDSEAARSEEKTENSKNMIRDFKQRKDRLIAETEKSGSNKVSIGESTGNLKVQIGELEKKVNELTEVTEKKASLLEDIRNNISRSDQKVSQLKDELFKASAEKSQLNNELSRFNSQLAGLQTESAGQNRELTKLNEQKDSSGNEISRLQDEIAELEEQSNVCRTDYEAVDKNCIEITERLKGLQTGLYADRERYITITSKIKVQEDLRQSDPEFRAVRTLVEHQMPGIHGPISSIIKVSPYNTEVVNRTLGEKINYLISETLEHAVDAIEYLKENRLGQAGFIVLERIYDIPEKEFISRLKGEKPVISAVSYDSKWEKVVKFLFSNKYHAGDTIYHEGIVYGGSNGEDVQRPDLNTLKEEAETLKKKLAEGEENIKSAETLLEEHSGRREEIDGTIKRFEVNISSLKKELDYKKSLLECAVKEIGLVTEEIAKGSDREREINNRISSSWEEISEKDNLETSLRTEIASLEDSISALRRHESGINPEFTELKSSLSAYQERLQSCYRELEKSNENYVMFEDRVVELNRQIDELDSGIKEHTDIYNYETKHTDQLYEARSGLEKEISGVQKEKTLLYERIDKKNKEVESLKHELNILQDRLHEIEVFCKTKQVEKTSYEKRLQERGTQFSEAKEKYGHIEPEPEEIQRLKRRIESMGAVNMTAEEQYTNLEERYKWIQDQQGDLLKAEENLRQAITKINSAIRQNFRETFEKVRDNFKKLFCELFEGGEADLILTDEANLLESGVEIVAQPPGKKLQSISLMSGGEKALTAIALLFSFFLVRPSPVCVLDEVDAPLDESNVVRFVNLIKSYSEKSQFVIVTHNRRSIETADTIYGITMEEFGISKIISLHLVKPQAETPREALKTTVPA